LEFWILEILEFQFQKKTEFLNFGILELRFSGISEVLEIAGFCVFWDLGI
jgi:hypothetical protein